MGAAGQRIIQENRGALARSYEIVWQYCASALAAEER
jgi:hypothetical protein